MAAITRIISKTDTINLYMSSTKSYFHDHFVLLLLTSNAFLALFTAIMLFLRLTSSHGSGYIVQYRSSLGVSAFRSGSITTIISFALFALLILAINIVMSYKTYHINRHLSILVLSMGIILTVLDIIVSNALLVLH